MSTIFEIAQANASDLDTTFLSKDGEGGERVVEKDQFLKAIEEWNL